MSVIIKGMDIPIDCLACRISCDKESYRVIGRPPKCPPTEAKTGDLISRADAIEALCHNCAYYTDAQCKTDSGYWCESGAIIREDIPSADAVSREDYHNLLTASEDIDRALREYQAKEEQLSAEVAPKIDHDRDWIIGCIEHDGFIHTHRFDKANQIILDALSAEAKTKCVAQIKVDTEEVVSRIKEEYDITDGWIPCSERLPECGVGLHYLVTLKDGHDFMDDVYEAFFDKYGWHVGDNELADDDVIAWMPLPEPYREREGE